MFTSTTSTSGYVMAYSRLVDEGLLEKAQDPEEFFSTIGYAGGYDRALLAVANGSADLAAVSYYTMEGPKADIYLQVEDRNKLRILTRTPGVPTHLIAGRADLNQEMKQKITEAFLKISAEQPDIIADVYGAATFVEATEQDHLESARQALENTGLLSAELVR
jgi:phosphonate transport system substrate-binding protein